MDVIMRHSDFYGLWEIIDCCPRSDVGRKSGIVGAVFELTRTGELRWRLPENVSDNPLFYCDAYEIVSRGQHVSSSLLRFGTYRGHILEFHIETLRSMPSFTTMIKGWCLMQIQRMGPPPAWEAQPPFSFLPALEDGYFSDLEIVAENKKVFKVHQCILKMSSPDLDWTASPPPLSGLPEEILGATLHYLYAQCLPSALVPSTVENILTMLAGIPALHGLRKLCTTYMSHLSFKNQIIDILNDIHACTTRMTENFSRPNIRYEPEKLCDTIKECAKDAAVAAAKLILLCDVYDKNKGQLSSEAGCEVIRYMQSRSPFILGKIKKFLLSVSSALSGLRPQQRVDIAAYLVPELETMLDIAVSVIGKVRHMAENLLTLGLKRELEETNGPISNIECKLNNLLHKKEVIRLRCLLQKITCVQKQLIQRKEGFRAMTGGNKVRSLARTLEQLIEEMPVFLLRLEEITVLLSHKFKWNESQFCFKVATAKVCDILKKLVKDKYIAKELMIQLCQLVDQDNFSQSIVSIGLLDSTQVPPPLHSKEKTDDPLPTETGSQLSRHGKSWIGRLFFLKGKKKHVQVAELNIIDSLCQSPCAQKNTLSDGGAALLNSNEGTDMVFAVVEEDGNVTSLSAHRVVVAARCDWFRRALLSGMQEDIHRRIEVHETTPQMFWKFLEYLYTGKIDSSTLTGEQLAELLLLSDRYEVDELKTACEEALKNHLNEDSWFDLLTLADQFNALLLKQSCADLICEQPHVLCQDICRQLPNNLLYEVFEWTRDLPNEGRSPRRNDFPNTLSLSGTAAANSPSRPEDLDNAVARLRNIVGGRFTRGQLESVLLAADLDVSRAIDLFYFVTS